jgi:hypothetical protein
VGAGSCYLYDRWTAEVFEQGGAGRASYGQALLKRLSADLSAQFGRGFGTDNLEQMRLFYLAYPPDQISETLSRKLPPKIACEKSRRCLGR